MLGTERQESLVFQGSKLHRPRASGKGVIQRQGGPNQFEERNAAPRKKRQLDRSNPRGALHMGVNFARRSTAKALAPVSLADS